MVATFAKQQDGVTLKPTVVDIVAAVESLYQDKIKPYGRIILRRVGEHAAQKVAAARGMDARHTDAVPRVDTKHLRRMCETCRQFRVVQEDGGEYAVFLVGRSPLFVDAGSAFDPYPAEFWCHMAAYFESLRGDDAVLPGGRYACAQLLAARALPFFATRCLGEICHIIALAVSHKKILGYADGHLVPFMHSDTGMKEHCAAWQQPVCNVKRSASSLPVATLEVARSCMRELLRSAAQEGPGNVPLPNVKRLFLSRFNLELSETALGHARVYDLLNDHRFHDVCRVHRQGSTYVVVPAVVSQTSCASERAQVTRVHSCLSTAPMQTIPLPMPVPFVAPFVPPIMPDLALSSEPLAQHDCPSWSAVDLDQSSQLDCSDESTAGTLHEDSNEAQFSLIVSSSSDFEDSPFLLEGKFSELLAREQDDNLSSEDYANSSDNDESMNECSVVRNTFIHVATPILQKPGARRRALSLPNIDITAGEQVRTPTSVSRCSWADEDPCDFSLNEETWESEVEEPHIHDISDADTDSSLPKLSRAVSSTEWKSWGRNCRPRGKWNSWGRWPEYSHDSWNNRSWKKWNWQSSNWR